MKKFLITCALLLLCGGTILLFSVPERVRCAFEGIAGYDLNKYETHTEKLPARTLDIDFSSLPNEPLTVYRHDGDVRVELDSVVFNGDGYTFSFTSYGRSSFSSGWIVCFENSTDRFFETDTGEFLYSLTGEGPLENDRITYTFALYPNSETCTVEQFANLHISIPLDTLTLVCYERK